MLEVSHAPFPGNATRCSRSLKLHLPHLTQSQLTGLAWWVCGTILAGSACQNAVASALSTRGNWNNLRQYLREWLYDGGDRARPCKAELDVSLCFAPLPRWVLAWWCSGRLALAVDPTLKGEDTTAIVISVVYRGCAIPVAWRILRANQRGAWMDPIVELLQALAPAVPREMTVVVLCDRGLASPKLWKQIVAQGWHPYMRYRKNITFCADGGKRLPARAFVSVPRHCLDRPRHRLRHTQRPAPLHPAGGLVLRTGGTLGHPHRPAAGGRRTQLVRPALLDRTGLQGPSRAWAGSGTRPGERTRRASPATGSCCRWPRCLPWPMAPGWKTPMTAGLPQATCGRRPGRCRPSITTVGRSRDGGSA